MSLHEDIAELGRRKLYWNPDEQRFEPMDHRKICYFLARSNPDGTPDKRGWTPSQAKATESLQYPVDAG